MQTFFSDDDYRAYLSLVVEWSRQFGNRIWAYCLMPNHVHLVVVPETPDGLCRGIGEAHRRYTRRINFREGWRGHLWQGRFASFVMDECHLLGATAYLERNPVKAGLVEEAQQWPWSSANAHVTGKPDGVAETDWLTDLTSGWVCTWRKYLRQDEASVLGETLRRHETTGRPLGDESFVKRVGAMLRRDLLPKKRGPKGNTKRKANN